MQLELLARRPCSQLIKTVSYDEDPVPDYGGTVDGWTNEIVCLDDIHLGTTDTLIYKKECKVLGLILLNCESPAHILSLLFPTLPPEVGISIAEMIDETCKFVKV